MCDVVISLLIGVKLLDDSAKSYNCITEKGGVLVLGELGEGGTSK